MSAHSQPPARSAQADADAPVQVRASWSDARVHALLPPRAHPHVDARRAGGVRTSRRLRPSSSSDPGQSCSGCSRNRRETRCIVMASASDEPHGWSSGWERSSDGRRSCGRRRSAIRPPCYVLPSSDTPPGGAPPPRCSPRQRSLRAGEKRVVETVPENAARLYPSWLDLKCENVKQQEPIYGTSEA